jgi:hypothetical protein
MQKKEYLYSNAVDLSTISEESPNKVIRKKIFKMFGKDLNYFKILIWMDFYLLLIYSE